MKSRLMMIASLLLATLISLPAGAQPGPGMGGMGPGATQGMGPGMGPGMMQGGGPRARAPRDCSLAANPAACNAHREARQMARQACQDKVGPQRRQCLHEQMQGFDCAKAANPQRCESRQMAYKACQGQAGPAFRQCVQQKMPAMDCSQAPNPARCEQHQKARAACQDKIGQDHMNCLREQFGVR